MATLSIVYDGTKTRIAFVTTNYFFGHFLPRSVRVGYPVSSRDFRLNPPIKVYYDLFGFNNPVRTFLTEPYHSPFNFKVGFALQFNQMLFRVKCHVNDSFYLEHFCLKSPPNTLVSRAQSHVLEILF